MTKIEMTTAILAAKKAKKTTWAAISKAARISEVYCTSTCLGENALELAEARKVAAFLRLPPKVVEALTEPACKGETSPAVPKEPLQYRLQEIDGAHRNTPACRAALAMCWLNRDTSKSS